MPGPPRSDIRKHGDQHVARHAYDEPSDADGVDSGSEVDDLGALIRGEIDDGKHPRSGRPPRKKRRHILPILAALIAIAIAAGAVYLAKDLFSGIGEVEDYAGAGTDAVTVRVMEGDTVSDIAGTLQEAGVVKSKRAFLDAAEDNTASQALQPGLYALKKEMKASLALEAMLDPTSIQTLKVTLPEGLTVEQTLATLEEATGITTEEFEAAIEEDRANLGLPEWAPEKGRVEGFLQPGTYNFDPEDTPLSILQTLVAQFNAVASQVGLVEGAKAVGQSPYELLTIASLIEREAYWDDERPKIARVIYNRLKKPMPLQIDAATAYSLDKPGNELTQADLDDESNPYNLRVVSGLPPTPIATVGLPSLDGALNPADGSWLYYVVNSDDQHHAFVTTAEEFEEAAQVCQQKGWC